MNTIGLCSTCLGIEGCFIVSDLGQSTKVVCCNGASSIVYCSCFPDESCEGGEWATQCCEPDQTCDCCEDE